MSQTLNYPLRLKRGATSAVASYAGPEGELVVDLSKHTVVVQTGTAGGQPLALANTQLIAGTGISITGGNLGSNNTISLAVSGVTAGSYGPTTNDSPAAGGNFVVPSLTVDSTGRITSVSNKTITLPLTSGGSVVSYTSNDNNITQHSLGYITIDGTDYPIYHWNYFAASTANAQLPLALLGSTRGVSAAGNAVNYFSNNVFVNPSAGALFANKMMLFGPEPALHFQNLSLTKGTFPENNGTDNLMYLFDSNGTGLACMNYYWNSTDKESYLTLTCFDLSKDSSSSVNAGLRLGTDASGNQHLWIPTPPADANNQYAATTEWVRNLLGGLSFTIPDTGVTANIYGPNGNKSVDFGGSFGVPTYEVNSSGRLVQSVTNTITLPELPTDCGVL